MKLSHTTTIAGRCAALLMATYSPWSAVAAEGGGIWRCGNTYTDQPCKGGRLIDVDDTRDARQKRDADDTIRDAHTAAHRMEGDRRRLEAAGAGNRPAVIDNAPRNMTPGRDSAPRKGKKEVLYASMQTGQDAVPKKKKSKKAEKKNSGD
ncbi:hypothetical protein VAR608DRAFT_3715 [Variovorax sp. HW608]|uniref:hypothetical protein n=1 Tax=Variovorax sp. HW608 TaxID=1034889 RepID=UPI00081FCCF8|nr:hypothetical protein [Variovorax sp. HW608]SCK39618.1 hypothetical protein VAR608DRAFT_3715 [Variovorax sp. HW608]